ncbi:hypothetical protein PAHAL_1G260100 [Panicum hallii]|uniref:Uncharacterized protein n=1 Tax=Panicum hallii TaxID=206008 RepID=A0A2S3GQ27_9POAL|nr:hypothetical protein PAHAL_1G260100 [Panicum hallii]
MWAQNRPLRCWEENPADSTGYTLPCPPPGPLLCPTRRPPCPGRTALHPASAGAIGCAGPGSAAGARSSAARLLNAAPTLGAPSQPARATRGRRRSSARASICAAPRISPLICSARSPPARTAPPELAGPPASPTVPICSA